MIGVLTTGHTRHSVQGERSPVNDTGQPMICFSVIKYVVLLQESLFLLQCGGVYVFSNFIGCDGERVYYDGCSMVAVNGDIVCQGAQFSLKEVVS